MRSEPTGRTEDYLEAIADLVASKGYARVKDVSEVLGVAPPSVTEMFKKLGEADLVNYERYGAVTLTSEGETIARSTREKHETLKRFLLILGVPQEIADMDACRIEHVVHEKTLKRISDFVKASDERGSL